MAKFITEILKDVNNDPSLLKSVYKDNAALRLLFEYAFIKEKKFILPEGSPPFKPDTAPLGMSPGNFYQEVKRFYVFCRTDLKPIRRETLFVQLLEGLHPSEADIILAIKDQKLHKMYPKITHKLVAEAGFVPMPEKAKKE